MVEAVLKSKESRSVKGEIEAKSERCCGLYSTPLTLLLGLLNVLSTHITTNNTQNMGGNKRTWYLTDILVVFSTAEPECWVAAPKRTAFRDKVVPNRQSGFCRFSESM